MQAQGQEPSLDPFEQLERSIAAKAAASRTATARRKTGAAAARTQLRNAEH